MLCRNNYYIYKEGGQYIYIPIIVYLDIVILIKH